VFAVERNAAMHDSLRERAALTPAHFDTDPLIDLGTTKRLLAAQAAANKREDQMGCRRWHIAFRPGETKCR
jgi:hypothetical protein